MNKEITVIVNKLSSEVDNFNYAIFEDKHDGLIKEVIEVSEKFSIDFQSWLVQNCTLNMRIWTYKKDKSRIYEITELLKIFKKQRE